MTKIVKAIQRSFKELLATCKQHETNPDFNENNFPLEPVDDDEDEWEVYEYHFDHQVNGFEAFYEFLNLGYRLCGPRRAMEYIANHLDDQLDHPLIVTTRYRHASGVWAVPLLDRYWSPPEFHRWLSAYKLNSDYHSHYGWLVLRKKTA